MAVSEVRKQQAPGTENVRLNKLLVDAMLEDDLPKEALRKMEAAPLRWELVRWTQTKPKLERRCL